jgi:hypothetical protein
MATDTIHALFGSVSDAERAIGALIDHGVIRENIGVIARNPTGEDAVPGGYTRVIDPTAAYLGEPIVAYMPVPGSIAPSPIANTYVAPSTVGTPDAVEFDGKEGLTTTTPEDALAGAEVGASIGLLAGILASAVALTLPGIGIILAGGALASAVAATAATTAAGAVVGGTVGYLRDMGMPENAAAAVADRLSQGYYLITVYIDTTQIDEVKQLLLKYNAISVDDTLRDFEPIDLAQPTSIVTEQLDGTPIVPALDVRPAVVANTYLVDEPFDDDLITDEALQQPAHR